MGSQIRSASSGISIGARLAGGEFVAAAVRRPGFWDDAGVSEVPGAAPSVESQVGAGFQAIAAGNWPGARDAFSAVLELAEVPEAFFGLANALFWLGDITGTIANGEKAYAGFRRRGDLMFAAGAALSLVGYNKGYLGNTVAARGWLARAGRIIEGGSRNCAGSFLVPPPTSRRIRWRARRWRARRWRSGARTETPTSS